MRKHRDSVFGTKTKHFHPHSECVKNKTSKSTLPCMSTENVLRVPVFSFNHLFTFLKEMGGKHQPPWPAKLKRFSTLLREY